ncbi:hypothetical protein KKC17_00490 [Patescibacteria group bacterium]|nr:hypothetical protein [Patescibacteria group bacterium]
MANLKILKILFFVSILLWIGIIIGFKLGGYWLAYLPIVVPFGLLAKMILFENKQSRG